MRTTVTLQDSLLARARRAALERNCTLGEVIDDALRETFYRRENPGRAPTKATRLPTFRGRGVQPGVDLTSTAGLLDAMEGR